MRTRGSLTSIEILGNSEREQSGNKFLYFCSKRLDTKEALNHPWLLVRLHGVLVLGMGTNSSHRNGFKRSVGCLIVDSETSGSYGNKCWEFSDQRCQNGRHTRQEKAETLRDQTALAETIQHVHLPAAYGSNANFRRSPEEMNVSPQLTSWNSPR